MEEPSENADWLAFGLQFIFGVAVGCFLGLVVIVRRHHGIWLHEELIFLFLAGTGLIGAGLGSLRGDRLWIGSSYRVIAPDAPTHSRTSRAVAVCAMVLGAALAGYSLFRHFS